MIDGLGSLFINDLSVDDLCLNDLGEQMATPSTSSDRRISFGVDSCVAASVLPVSVCEDYPLIPVSNPVTYRSATGQTVKEQGSRRLLGTMNGSLRGVKAKVLKVQRPLLSVFDMVEAGHKVIFEKVDGVDMSRCENLTSGEVAPFVVRNRCWDLDVDVLPAGDASAALRRMNDNNVPQLAPFIRQARQAGL